VQRAQVAARSPDVNGLADKMKTVLSDAGAVSAQERIGFGRTVTGDDVKRLSGLQFIANREQQIQESRIDVFDLVGPKVAQDVIDFA
jgi:hypothetical protein